MAFLITAMCLMECHGVARRARPQCTIAVLRSTAENYIDELCTVDIGYSLASAGGFGHFSIK